MRRLRLAPVGKSAPVVRTPAYWVISVVLPSPLRTSSASPARSNVPLASVWSVLPSTSTALPVSPVSAAP